MQYANIELVEDMMHSCCPFEEVYTIGISETSTLSVYLKDGTRTYKHEAHKICTIFRRAIIIKNHGLLSSVLNAYCRKNYWVPNALMQSSTIPSKSFK